MKKVSVIIPCYNAGDKIDRCIQSLVNQTLGLDNMEIILVNDASTDNTLDRLKLWESRFSDSILLIDSKVNTKTGGARNLGMQYASGDYIGFVDNDDWVDSTMYEKMYTAAEEHHCDLVSVLYARESQDGIRFPFQMPKGRKNILVDATKPLPEGVSPLPGEVWCKLYRKSFLFDNDLFFLEGLLYTENYWGPLMKYYLKSYYIVDEVLYHYMQNNQSVIGQSSASHTADRLEVEMKLLQEIERRGLDDIHSPAIENRFMHTYYVNTLHLYFHQHLDALPYEVLYQMREGVFTFYPHYYDNTLLRKSCANISTNFLLRTLEVHMTDELWEQVAAEYKTGHYDLSIFLNAKKEERVPHSVEPHDDFRIGYLLTCEFYTILRDFYQDCLTDGLTAPLWSKYITEIAQRLVECQEVTDFIRQNNGISWQPYNSDIIKDFLENMKNAFDAQNKDLFLQSLESFCQYLELPKQLYHAAWCQADVSTQNYLPCLEYCYTHPQEPDLLRHARKVILDHRSPIFSFPYDENPYPTEIAFEQQKNMFYFVQNGIRLYLPYEKYNTIEKVEHYVYGLLVEQDSRSPHCYLNDRMAVKENSVIIDAGTAEGNFAASVIQTCQKIYFVECDKEYIKALKISFHDYLDKIVFVEKFLDGYDDETHITIDTLLNGEEVNYIKMDIEGCEPDALRGASHTLTHAKELKCNICSYHHLEDEERICEILSEYDMEITHTPGYMFLWADKEHPSYPRRGLVQAIKR